jgi:hypothetical protein
LKAKTAWASTKRSWRRSWAPPCFPVYSSPMALALQPLLTLFTHCSELFFVLTSFEGLNPNIS